MIISTIPLNVSLVKVLFVVPSDESYQTLAISLHKGHLSLATFLACFLFISVVDNFHSLVSPIPEGAYVGGETLQVILLAGLVGMSFLPHDSWCSQ